MLRPVDAMCRLVDMETTRAKDPAILDRLRQARLERDQTRERSEAAFAEQVRAAMAQRNGYLVREIAEAAGLSRERVYQITGRR
jgi:DNA-binding phage protein